MILSRIYSNQSNYFEPIEFNTGLNIIIGEIRLPENKKKDTHNLGKSTLALLIDFCLLRGQSKEFFLFKHFDIFKEFIFFLEIEYKENSFVTIKRGVDNNSKISFIEHKEKYLDFANLPDEDWTHLNIPFEKAIQMLDGILDLEVVSPWDYRKPSNYALRSQDDYGDVFQLSKYVHHIDWKPYVAKLLGLNSELVKKQYELKKDYDKVKNERDKLKNNLIGFTDSLDKLEGLILIKNQEADLIQEQLNDFNFEAEDSKINKELVEKLDSQISQLNKDKYYISTIIENLKLSLEKHSIIFNLKEAQSIFQEAGILFDGQIKKTYDELINFNKDITNERKKYLAEDLEESQNELVNIGIELKQLNRERSEALYFLKDTKTIEKYKLLTNTLIKLDAEILSLRKQEEKLVEYNNTVELTDLLKSQSDANKILIANNVKQANTKDSTYSKIKLNFNAIVKSMLDKDALISLEQNDAGNLNFKADILNNEGHETSESDGHTYKKLLCMAFDIAINQLYISDKYTHFLYHDGFLEKLDNRKKEQFIELIREFTNSGFQYIGTLIDSELPNQNQNYFTDDEVILVLHDDGASGKLFKMSDW